MQKSIDGIHYETIGIIFSWDNSAENTYYFTDGKPARGVNYYRLNIIDKDGAAKYSAIINFKLNTNQDAIVTLAPNPGVYRQGNSTIGLCM